MIQVLERYELAPGACRFCSETKRTPEEMILDLGVTVYDPEIGWDGRMYLCQTCLTDWGHKMGLISAPEAAELTEALVKAERRIAEQDVEIETLSQARGVVLAAAESLRPPELIDDLPLPVVSYEIPPDQPEFIEIDLPDAEGPISLDDDEPITLD